MSRLLFFLLPFLSSSPTAMSCANTPLDNSLLKDGDKWAGKIYNSVHRSEERCGYIYKNRNNNAQNHSEQNIQAFSSWLSVYILYSVCRHTHTHSCVSLSASHTQLPPLITERERNKAMKCFSGSLSQKQKEEVIHRRRDIKIWMAESEKDGEEDGLGP